MMCSAPTRRMTKVRLSTDSLHQVVILRRTPEYQYLWFRFYCASLFPACWMLHHLLTWQPLQDHRHLSRASATDLAAVTVAEASSEANTRPPLSFDIDITATTVTTAADVADDARYDPAVNVDGGPSPAALDNDADDGGGGNTLVQAAVVSIILNAAKSSLLAYFEGVRWPLNKASAFRLS